MTPVMIQPRFLLAKTARLSLSLFAYARGHRFAVWDFEKRHKSNGEPCSDGMEFLARSASATMVICRVKGFAALQIAETVVKWQSRKKLFYRLKQGSAIWFGNRGNRGKRLPRLTRTIPSGNFRQSRNRYRDLPYTFGCGQMLA
jgi:hypothetical protein